VSATSERAIEYLVRKIDWFELRFASLAAGRTREPAVEADRQAAAMAQQLHRMEDDDREPLPVRRLRREQGLEPFEVDALLLATLARQDEHLCALAAAALGLAQPISHVTPWIVLSLLCETRRDRLTCARLLTPEAPLVGRGLVSLVARDGAANPLLQEIVPAGFLPAFLRGQRAPGPQLAPFARAYVPEITLDDVALRPEDRAALEEVAGSTAPPEGVLAGARRPGRYGYPAGLAFLITGASGSGKTLAARGLASATGCHVLELDAGSVAMLPPELAVTVLEQAFAEAAFFGEWLVLDACDRLLCHAPEESPFPDRTSDAAAGTFRRELARRPVTVVLTATRADDLAESVRERLAFQHELAPMTRDLCSMAWQVNVPEAVLLAPDVDFQRLTDVHALTGRGIQNAIALALRDRPVHDGMVEVDQARLTQCARYQESPGMGRFAERTWVVRSRDDLLLPDHVGHQVDEIVATERIRESILKNWGMGERMQKGLGICCLFDGEPGTGKTLAAEVIASELGLPLYTVAISNVVSKYIGETEKHLRRIFNDAQKSRCVLLFDEADTLFAKRTDVNDAISRYANMETGLLLQLVENYRGLVVLTTNLRESIDRAFLRRLTFKIEFPFPDEPARARIWRRLLPIEHCAADLDPEELAERYELSGGSIRNVVLRSAYRAAVGGGVIGLDTIASVAREELRSLGKLVRERSEDTSMA